MFKPVFIGALLGIMTLSLPILSPGTAKAHYRKANHHAPYCRVHHRYHYHKKPKRYFKPRRIAYKYPPPVRHCYWQFGRLHCFWAPY